MPRQPGTLCIPPRDLQALKTAERVRLFNLLERILFYPVTADDDKAGYLRPQFGGRSGRRNKLADLYYQLWVSSDDDD